MLLGSAVPLNVGVESLVLLPCAGLMTVGETGSVMSIAMGCGPDVRPVLPAGSIWVVVSG